MGSVKDINVIVYFIDFVLLKINLQDQPFWMMENLYAEDNCLYSTG